MEMPDVGTSGETLVKDYGLYHQVRLDGDKSLKDMAETWRKAQGRLKIRVDADEAAITAVRTAAAVRDGEDAALDETVREFYGALLSKAKNDRQSPLFAIYFPEGVPAMVNAPMEAEIQKVSVLLKKLEQDEDEGLRNFAGPITETMNHLMAAIDAHKAAVDAEVQAYGLVQMEKVNWFDSYKLSHRTLGQRFYKDRKKPDTYFKPAPKRKRPPGGPPQETPKA